MDKTWRPDRRRGSGIPVALTVVAEDQEHLGEPTPDFAGVRLATDQMTSATPCPASTGRGQRPGRPALPLTEYQRHATGPGMSTVDRTSGWEAMHRSLAADAVLADAALYASGSRRLTVEHGQPLTEQAADLVRQLVGAVDQAVAAAGYRGGGTATSRPTLITWTFPSHGVPARTVVLAARQAADTLNPGSWIVSADDHA